MRRVRAAAFACLLGSTGCGGAPSNETRLPEGAAAEATTEPVGRPRLAYEDIAGFYTTDRPAMAAEVERLLSKGAEGARLTFARRLLEGGRIDLVLRKDGSYHTVFVSVAALDEAEWRHGIWRFDGGSTLRLESDDGSVRTCVVAHPRITCEPRTDGEVAAILRFVSRKD